MPSALYRFHVILKRDIVNLALNPVLLLSNTVFPLLLMLILGYLTRSIYGGGEVSSYDYYGVTIVIFASLNVSMIASNSFMEKSLRKSNLRILHAPVRTSYLYISKFAATFFFSTLCTLLLLALAHWVLNVHYGGSGWIVVALILIGFNLFSSALGVLMCCLFRSEETSNKILSFVNNLLALIGGLFFQWDGLGRAAEILSYLSPVKWVAEAVFRVIYDQDAGMALPLLGGFAAGSLVLLWGCSRIFHAEDYV
ncbi:ABC transporter permease [Paenibacillus dendritiformis]|uniref:ABC-type MDR transport system, permease n=1 Tax=Paenibacillus dendritiformis C454 TaxID=1131935 RepID=H3SKF9_9BACL|nr:ABC transporter permease [Paenibacillus dendritiformis]EHQ60449.1 ABC-type MDR transport system, permease [Paenibacillus dendritiformis C454]CAH8770590.1 ABC transporter permease [Paenibacillus dendritiformis]